MSIEQAAAGVFRKHPGRDYPIVDRAEGVRLYTADGGRILDACSGGAMAAGLGHGVDEIVDAAASGAGGIGYYYAHHFTNLPQEQLAERLAGLAPGMSRVRFQCGGSEANETALRLARQYHVDRGDADRWLVISPAQAYHGATLGTLALSGRAALREPYGPYMAGHLHIPPCTERFDPTGRAALEALDEALEQAGPGKTAAFFCETVSGLSLPGYSPPDRFWEGLEERRRRHGFLICLDEVVVGLGRTGRWFAYEDLPLVPDIVTLGKTLGAGFTPLSAVLCRAPVYQALADGSKEFDLGHTWDGAPLSCAVGSAVIDYIDRHDLVNRVAGRGPALYGVLKEAVGGMDMVGRVRGRGFLLGVEHVDPRDGRSILPPSVASADLVDSIALENGLLVRSTPPDTNRWAGGQTLLAPAFTSTDQELAEMIERFAGVMEEVERIVKDRLRNGATT